VFDFCDVAFVTCNGLPLVAKLEHSGVKSPMTSTNPAGSVLGDDRQDVPLVLIVTALEKEFRAVRKHISNRKEIVDRHGNVFETGTFTAPGCQWEVLVVQTGPGNLPAHTLVTQVADARRPHLIMLVGISGGLKDDLNIGDVVASRKVCYCEGGKEDGVFLARPETIPVRSYLIQRAYAIARNGDWLSRIDKYDAAHPPQAHVAPIAVVEKVLASSAASTSAILKTHYSDCLVVEMEGYGTMKAAFELETAAIVIRAVSDHRDGKSASDSGGSQEIACENASAFAFEFLARFTPPARLEMPGKVGGGGWETEVTGRESEPPNRQDKAELTLIVEGEIDSISESQLKMFEERLQQLSQDSDLKVRSIESGSIILNIQGTSEGLSRIKEIHRQGRLTNELDAPIKAVYDRELYLTIKEIKDSFKSASRVLLNWPTTIDGGHWLRRREIGQIEDIIAGATTSSTIVLGSPGSGKSAVIAKLAVHFAEAGLPVLAIKADTLSTTIDSEEKLSAALALPLSVSTCVKTLSERERVVVCIDQLDAVASLVDLHSERLNVLISLINKLAQVPNVHVVSSSRDFELRHDVRLTQINAEPVNLDLPSWDQVSALLAAKHIDASQWPERFRNILRTPQHLKIFVNLLENHGQKKIYESYHAMLEDLWQKEVLGKGHAQRAQLLSEIALEMGQTESLWLPITKFEGDLHAIEDLVSAGILVKSQQGAALSFCHQTLFDYAWARAFVSKGADLSGYVRARQDGLYVRPKLWTSLLFMRQANPSGYQQQFEVLWKNPDLRKHIRLLLLDFLGYIEGPDTQETKWFLEAFQKPELRNRAIFSAIGNRYWFHELSSAHLPFIMRQDKDLAWKISPLLIRALAFASADVLKLIRENWLQDSDKDELTVHVLRYLKEWDQNSIDLACNVLSRSPVHPHLTVSLATGVAEASPQLAGKIVKAGIRSEIRKIQTNKSQQSDKPLQSPIERLLESHEWYGLSTIAEAAPREFLMELWPLFVDLVNEIAHKEPLSPCTYRSAYLPLDSAPESEAHPLIESVKLAVRQLAKHDKGSFLEFAKSAERVELHCVQRILACAFRDAIEHLPKEALQFVLRDERRLFLGSVSHVSKDSVELIEALCSRLKDDEIPLLEEAILRIGKAVKPKGHLLERSKYLRARRLVLLKAVPFAKLSKATQTEIDQEQRALPANKLEEHPEPEFRWVGSPMSAEQMTKARNADVIRLFEKLNDDTEWNHPKRFLQGGSIQASRAFKEFCKFSPTRAVSIIEHLKPGDHERPVGYALEGLAESDISSNDLFHLFLELNERGFASQEYKVLATMAVSKRIVDGSGLPQSVCEVLEEWLASSWNPVEHNYEGVPENFGSILWSHDHIYSIPQGSFTVLETLTRVYLRRIPVDKERWFNMLKTHLARPEHPIVWQLFALELRFLAHCDSRDASTFLIELFDKYPSVRDSVHGSMLLAYVLKWLEPSTARQFLMSLKNSDWTYGPQAFGELLLLFTGLFPNEQWSSEEIEAAVTSHEPTDDRTDKIRTGLGYAAANMLSDLRFRQLATETLLKLGPKASIHVSEAIMSVFKQTDSLFPDEATSRILQMLDAHPKIWQHGILSSFVEHLEQVLPTEPELVYRICKDIIAFAETRTSIVHDFSGVAGTLTNIALTLQRYEAEHRGHGIELFERLLELNSNDAWNAVNELDGRPVEGYSLPSRPRRKRFGKRLSR
jgi:nucleoside phosphorylase